MRLNFSFVEPEKIRRGIEILAEVIRERMELRGDLERGARSAASGQIADAPAASSRPRGR
jgi:2-aminoadipate transaminase